MTPSPYPLPGPSTRSPFGRRVGDRAIKRPSERSTERPRDRATERSTGRSMERSLGGLGPTHLYHAPGRSLWTWGSVIAPTGGARGDPISDNMQRAEWKGEERRGSAEGRGGRTWGAPLDMGSLGGRQPQISKHSRNITTSIIKFGRNVGWEGPRQQASHGQPASHQASQQASHPGLLRSSVFVFNLLP